MLNRANVCAHKSSFIGTLSVVIVYELVLTGFTVWRYPAGHTYSPDNILKRNISLRAQSGTDPWVDLAMVSAKL